MPKGRAQQYFIAPIMRRIGREVFALAQEKRTPCKSTARLVFDGCTLASLAFMFYVHSRQGPLGIWDLIFPITAVLAYFWPFGLLMSLDCS